MLSDVSQLHCVKCLMQQTSTFKQVPSPCDFILMEMLSLSSFGYIELVFENWRLNFWEDLALRLYSAHTQRRDAVCSALGGWFKTSGAFE